MHIYVVFVYLSIWGTYKYRVPNTIYNSHYTYIHSACWYTKKKKIITEKENVKNQHH